jgi:error-prone DNA polymerase
VNDGVTQFIERYVHGAPWEFDHPLEERALARTKGIILFQDQVNQLATDVAGFSPKEADDLRRAFGRRNNRTLLEMYWERFKDGCAGRGVPEATAVKVFKKFSGQYMFPESHAYAFGITAYQMAWLKYYYPLEFFVAIFNQQPMGFYNLETLKEDARRHGVNVLNPNINESRIKCVIKDESLLLGFLNVKGVGQAGALAVVEARERGGPFDSLADAMQRTGLQQEMLDNLAAAGAFDAFTPDRRAAVWEVGLRYRPVGIQQVLPLPVEQDSADLPALTPWENMMAEYRVMGLHPKGHFMAHLRPLMDPGILSSDQLADVEDGKEVSVAGLVIRRQHPNSNAVFITLEDEFGHTPLVVWPQVFKRFRLAIKEPVLKVEGFVSRRDGSMNVVATRIEGIKTVYDLPKSKNWG